MSKTTKPNLLLPSLSCRFVYDGVVRHVDNVTIEPDYNSIIGYERRKGGKYSNKIKRYKVNKMEYVKL